jgi:hypothetical protein
MIDPIECASCLAQAPYDEDSGAFELDGWDLKGEFGIQCPTCVAEQGGAPSGPMVVSLTEKDAEAIAGITQEPKPEEK